MITICHQSASLVMPKGDPRDRFFYPALTLMIDSYRPPEAAEDEGNDEVFFLAGRVQYSCYITKYLMDILAHADDNVYHTLLRSVCVTMSNVRNIRISDGCVYAQIRKGLGMHLVTYTNSDTVPFLLLIQYKGGLSEIEFTVTLFSNAGMILLSYLKILCISSYIKGGIAHF